jgi:DNA-binding CsgD family transcriptional regulator
LTRREREVLALVAAGLLNKQIAAELGMAEKTVKQHRGGVMRKMAVESFADLVVMANRLGVRPVGVDLSKARAVLLSKWKKLLSRQQLSTAPSSSNPKRKNSIDLDRSKVIAGVAAGSGGKEKVV